MPDFTIVVTDIVMPGEMNGFDLAREARNLKPDLRIVLMTGYAGRDRWDEMETCDFPILRKPFEPSDLAIALRDAAI